MSSCKINDIFPYINTKEFESFAVKAVTAQLNKEGLQPVEEIKFTLDTYCKEQQFSYVGYIPAVLSVSMSTTYLGGNAHKDNWLSKFALGTFAHDASNCGVGSVHNINGLRIKGFGSCILALLENMLAQNNRHKILSTINALQTEAGAGLWLVKRGFKEIDTFIGGNSKKNCTVFSKDLNESPVTKYPIWKEEDAK